MASIFTKLALGRAAVKSKEIQILTKVGQVVPECTQKQASTFLNWSVAASRGIQNVKRGEQKRFYTEKEGDTLRPPQPYVWEPRFNALQQEEKKLEEEQKNIEAQKLAEAASTSVCAAQAQNYMAQAYPSFGPCSPPQSGTCPCYKGGPTCPCHCNPCPCGRCHPYNYPPPPYPPQPSPPKTKKS